jgi:hypothetical protein
LENPTEGAVLGNPSSAGLTIKPSTPTDGGDDGTTSTMIYLPVILKLNGLVDEHAAEFIDIFLE